MTDVVLVLNAGSSSLKFSVFAVSDGQLPLLMKGQVEAIGTAPRFLAKDAQGRQLAAHAWGDGARLGHDEAITYVFEFLRGHAGDHELIAVGHRVVHGGRDFVQATRIDPTVTAALAKLVPLAPLHQPHNLAPMNVVATLLPGVTQVACFDTAFHQTQPEVAQAIALPPSITALGVRRYGFHGLSYEYIADALTRLDPTAAAGRTVVAHLGNGSSLCAMVAGRSVATTMGFSTLDGVPMGTRCGSLDPGVLLYLIDQLGMDARAIEQLLYKNAGLLGVSGLSSDMRTLLASETEGARDAVDLFVYRLGRELGSLAAAARGLDALVFTAGIGENAVAIRERICRDAAWLGLVLDPAANEAGGPCISTADSKVKVWVIPTNEELVIARHTLAVAREAR